jgi:hypothetical protein
MTTEYLNCLERQRQRETELLDSLLRRGLQQRTESETS